MYSCFTVNMFILELPVGCIRLICHGVAELTKKNKNSNHEGRSDDLGAWGPLQDEGFRDSILARFNYQGPLEKEISAIQSRIDDLKNEKDQALAKIDSYKTLETDGQLEDDLDLAGYKCGNCHLRQNHKKKQMSKC